MARDKVLRCPNFSEALPARGASDGSGPSVAGAPRWSSDYFLSIDQRLNQGKDGLPFLVGTGGRQMNGRDGQHPAGDLRGIGRP